MWNAITVLHYELINENEENFLLWVKVKTFWIPPVYWDLAYLYRLKIYQLIWRADAIQIDDNTQVGYIDEKIKNPEQSPKEH